MFRTRAPAKGGRGERSSLARRELSARLRPSERASASRPAPPPRRGGSPPSYQDSRRCTPRSASSALSILPSSASISRSVNVRAGSRKVQRQVTPRVPGGSEPSGAAILVQHVEPGEQRVPPRPPNHARSTVSPPPPSRLPAVPATGRARPTAGSAAAGSAYGRRNYGITTSSPNGSGPLWRVGFERPGRPQDGANCPGRPPPSPPRRGAGCTWQDGAATPTVTQSGASSPICPYQVVSHHTVGPMGGVSGSRQTTPTTIARREGGRRPDARRPNRRRAGTRSHLK